MSVYNDSKYINAQTITSYANTNEAFLEGKVCGIVLEFPGLGGGSCFGGSVERGTYDSPETRAFAKNGIVVAYMFPGPWSWGSKAAIRMADAVVDAIIEKAYGLSVAFLEQEIYHYISWYDCKRGEIVRRDVTSADDIWNILYEIYHTSLYEDVAALQFYDGISYGNGVYLFYITTDENTVVKYEPHKIYVVGEI